MTCAHPDPSPDALLAVLVDEEGAVAHAADPELLLSHVQELPANGGARRDRGLFHGSVRCDLGHVHHLIDDGADARFVPRFTRPSGSGASVLVGFSGPPPG